MNDSQNPSVNNNQTTVNGTAPATNTNVAPAAPSPVAINIGSQEVSAPTAPVATPMPAPQPAPVEPTPMPAPQPALAPVTPVQANGEDSPFFTPESVQPETQVSPELPPVAPAQPVQQVVAQPAVQAQPATQPATQPAAQPQVAPAVQAEAVPTAPQGGVEVIETAPKSKASNFILIIFLLLLILFVFNIDTIIKMYDQYKNAQNPQNPINKNTNNLTDGYILINENTSSIKVKDIKFYNFRQTQGKGITFSYEVLTKAEDAKALEIYIELYNSNKEMIYKELYNPSQKLEKDTVRTYIMDVDDDIYANAFYALVKVYTEEEKSKTVTLSCDYEDSKYIYRHKYNFTNNGLTSYDIEKTIKIENNEALKNEYESLSEINNATLEDHTLKYTVNLDKDNGDLVLLFEKDTALVRVKDKLTSKEWICE